jgi:hypothetical protein
LAAKASTRASTMQLVTMSGGSGGGTSGGGHNGGPRLNALDGPQRGGDVYLQIDRQTLVVFKNALDDLSRGTR